MTRIKSSIATVLAVLASAGFSGAAFAVPCVWNGATNGNWSVPGNWSCAGGPNAGDDLQFPNGATTFAMNQDIANLSVNSLAFSGNSGGYSLTGTGNLTISGGAAMTSAATGANQNTLALTNPLKFGAATAVIDTSTGAGGRLNLNGPIDLNGSVLSLVWDATVPQTHLNGVISGSGGLSVDGIGADQGLYLAGDNTFSGTVSVNSGYLVLDHPHALGAGGSLADGTSVGAGGTLVLHVDIANEHLTLAAGGGTSGNGNVQSNGVRVWGGPVVLNNVGSTTTTFNLLGSQVTFSGAVTGAGGFLCCNQTSGKIALSGSGSTYSGPSSFSLNGGGTLLMLADNSLSPNSAVILGGTTGGILDMGAFSGTAASFSGSANSVLRMTAGQKFTVNGAVALNNSTLTLSVVGDPAIGTVFTILDKTGAGAITGTFGGLAEGATVTVGPFGMKISYVGGTGNDVTLTLQTKAEDVALTVTRAGSGSGTVSSDVGDINCGAICTDSYAHGTTIKLTATPDGGSQFMGWLGPCTGTGACQFTINAATTAVATFAPTLLGAPVLDVDASVATTQYDALTDGLLVIRYLFALSGTPLITGALGPDATRTLAAEVFDYLTDIKPALDIDGNGQADALTDGLLIIRYLFGLRNADLIAGAVGPGPTRFTAADIQAQIESLMP
jgi:autotransporter-associated beta strand protein